VAGTLPQALLGELIALPKPPSWLGERREMGKGRQRKGERDRSIPVHVFLFVHFEHWYQYTI